MHSIGKQNHPKTEPKQTPFCLVRARECAFRKRSPTTTDIGIGWLVLYCTSLLPIPFPVGNALQSVSGNAYPLPLFLLLLNHQRARLLPNGRKCIVLYASCTLTHAYGKHRVYRHDRGRLREQPTELQVSSEFLYSGFIDPHFSLVAETRSRATEATLPTTFCCRRSAHSVLCDLVCC